MNKLTSLLFAFRVVELTGDVSPDAGLLRRADVIVTTPEKWDGVSRSWRQRAYVRQIALIVIDEIHMVGEERGPILEVRLNRGRRREMAILEYIVYP